MATLLGVGHKRGRSSSTTTAIQRPGAIVLTTRTISSNTNIPTAPSRPRRLSTEGMGLPSLNTTLPIANTLTERRTRRTTSWLSSMASHVPGVGSYWTTSHKRRSMEMSESGESSSIMFSGPPSPSQSSSAHIALTDWSPRAASPAYTPLLFVILLFPLSTALVIGTVWTLPIRLPSTDDETQHSVFPRTVSEVRALAWALKGYSETGSWELIHVLAVLAVTALWKHAWSIPGSVLLNILTGTLLPPVLATLLQTSLTTLGSVLSTILATPLTPIITRFFPSAIELTRSALEGPSSSGPSSSSTSTYPPSTSPSVLSSSTTLRDSISTRPSTPTSFSPINPKQQQQQQSSNSSPWARLAVLRLIGIVPWSGINVACGVCGVSLRHCATGAFIGTLPWTAVTCQIGDILQTFASSPVSPNSSTAAHQTISSILTSPEIIFKLFILTFISLAPILAKERLSAWLNGTTEDLTIVDEKEERAEEKERERLYLNEKNASSRKGRGHRKRFSVEWWRRSLSLSRPEKDELQGEEERLDMLGPDERA